MQNICYDLSKLPVYHGTEYTVLIFISCKHFWQARKKKWYVWITDYNLKMFDVMSILQDDINTYHCGWVYVPSDCWTGWSVHDRCHIRRAFHLYVYEGDVSAWMCLGLHMYSVDTEEREKKLTLLLLNISPERGEVLWLSANLI